MQAVLDVEDVRRVEVALSREGVSVSELMHRAGHALAHEVEESFNPDRVLVLCGLGNNGGDGWVCASLLARDDVNVSVVTPVEPRELTGNLVNAVANNAQRAGVPYVVAPPREKLIKLIEDADVVVDAMLGTGFHGRPRSPFDIWIECVNAYATQVVAADVPSGLSAETGRAEGMSVNADVTVTMISLKPGLIADDGRDLCGRIVVAPLADQAEQLIADADPLGWRTAPDDYLPVILAPSSAQDKYTRGSVLVIAGSARYPGAAILAAKAAARAGAGYVTLAVPAPAVSVASMHLVEIPVVGLPADDYGCFAYEGYDRLVEMAQKVSAVVVGPGLGKSSALAGLIASLIDIDVPLVIDADGLNALARLANHRLDEFPEVIRRTAPVVLTPHRVELARLVGRRTKPAQSLVEQIEDARRIVWASGGSELCVLTKSSASACVGVERAILPEPGPACLATAGSGDVLAGIMGSLIAQTAGEVSDIALLAGMACEIHAAAAHLAAKQRGTCGVMAGDLVEVLGLARDQVETLAMMPEDLLEFGDDESEEEGTGFPWQL